MFKLMAEGKAEAAKVVAGVGNEVVAKRHTAVLRIVVPTATAKHAGRA